MLAKCPTSLKFIPSIMKLQQSNGTSYLKPALHLCTGEISVRFAGHSKWQNIRHTKASKDRAKCILFSRMVREVERAAAKGSLDPKLNSELARVLTSAQTANVPSTTLNKALVRVENRRKNPVTKVIAFKGPQGVYIVSTLITDDFRRSKGDLSRIVKKYKFVVYQGDPMSAFSAKGWVLAKPPENIKDVADQSLEDAIEVGAEEVIPDEENPEILKFICECSELPKVRSKLESRNYTIEEAYEQYTPRYPIELPEEDMQIMNNLMEEFEELPEVEKVFTNIA